MRSRRGADDLGCSSATSCPSSFRSSTSPAATRPPSTTPSNCSCLGGRRLPHVMMMLIPEAWDKEEQMNPEKRAFYEYHACLMEPWDGPAAVAFTDGAWIGAVLDRNGLRPARYIVTDDDLVVMASETGVIAVDPAKVRIEGTPSARQDLPGRYRSRDASSATRRSRGRSVRANPTGNGWRRTRSILRELPPSRQRIHEVAMPRRSSFASRFRLYARRPPTDPRSRWRRTANSRSARWERTRRWRCSRIARSSSTTTSSSSSHRSQTRRSTRSGRSW